MKTDNDNVEKETKEITEEKSCATKCCLFGKFIKIAHFKLFVLDVILAPVVLLITRLYMARIFWKSGQTKIDNLDNTEMLFEWEYLPKWEENSTKTILGMDITFPVPNAELAGTMATYTELAMPVLLVLGLMGRFGAFVLFGMAATIELFIYPGTTEHYYWMLILGILVVMGPGKISIDHFIRKYFLGEKSKCCPAKSDE